MDPLRLELSRLLRQASNQSTANQAMKAIYDFKKRNPDYNMDSVLSEQSKYIHLFVKRRLEMMAWNEGRDYLGHFSFFLPSFSLFLSFLAFSRVIT